MHKNYPNPFNPETDIRFELPEPAEVTLKIFNIRGEEVQALFQGTLEAGFHSIHWQGKNNYGQSVSTGIYIYQIEVRLLNNPNILFSQRHKMTLIK